MDAARWSVSFTMRWAGLLLLALSCGATSQSLAEPSQSLVDSLNHQVDELRTQYPPRDTCSALWSEPPQSNGSDGPLLPELVAKDVLAAVFAPMEKHALANGLYRGGRPPSDLSQRLAYVVKERNSLSAIINQASPFEASIFRQSLEDLTYEAEFLERLLAPPDASEETAAHIGAVGALASYVAQRITELPATSTNAERLQAFERRGLRNLRRSCNFVRPEFMPTGQWQFLLDGHASHSSAGMDGFVLVEAAITTKYIEVFSDPTVPFTSQFLQFETSSEAETIKSRFTGPLADAAAASGLIDAIDSKARGLEILEGMRQTLANKIAEETKGLARIDYSLAKLAGDNGWGVPQSAGSGDYELLYTQEDARYSLQTKLSCVGARSQPTVQVELLVIGKDDRDARWSVGNARSHQVEINYSESGKSFRRAATGTVKRVGYTDYQNSILVSLLGMQAKTENYVNLDQNIATEALGGQLAGAAENDRAENDPIIEGTGRLQISGKFWIGGHQVAWRSPNILEQAVTIYAACAEFETTD